MLPIGIVCLGGLGGFGLAYALVTYGLGHPEAQRLAAVLRRDDTG